MQKSHPKRSQYLVTMLNKVQEITLLGVKMRELVFSFVFLIQEMKKPLRWPFGLRFYKNWIDKNIKCELEILGPPFIVRFIWKCYALLLHLKIGTKRTNII